VVAEICDRVAVLYAGEVVELAPRDALLATPAHPYSRALLASSPRLGRPAPRGEMPAIPGRPADPARLPGGCAFHPRCARAFERCRGEAPAMISLAPDRQARCFLLEPGAESL